MLWRGTLWRALLWREAAALCGLEYVLPEELITVPDLFPGLCCSGRMVLSAQSWRPPVVGRSIMATCLEAELIAAGADCWKLLVGGLALVVGDERRRDEELDGAKGSGLGA